MILREYAMEYFMILLGTVLVNNVVLVKFLGLCPFRGVSKQIDSAIGMGMAIAGAGGVALFADKEASGSSFLGDGFAAATAVWYYFIQREACGIRNQKPAIEHYGIPREVLMRLGAR